MTGTVTVYDATHDNVSQLPPGQAAGYSTGTGTHIRWDGADWAAHPGAVRIDQDPSASDPSADILDVETGAATVNAVCGWVKSAIRSYALASRPGQRKPAIYMSRSNVTGVCNALVAGGVTSAGLWIADWGRTADQAAAEVAAASGPFPVIGVQYRNAGAYDVSVFSQAWLGDVSAAAGMQLTAPPGTWKSGTEVVTFGLGPGGDALWYTVTADGTHWTAPARLSP
jgi:hypothetical protein